MNKLTLKRLYNTGFKDLYWKLLSNPSEITKTELVKILELGSYFVTRDNADIQKLGYRLFLLYSKLTGDYKPLYEISINKGLIPISQFIYEQMEYSDQYGNLQTMINSIVNQEFKVNDFPMEEIMFDPQTSGGLLISLPEKYGEELLEKLNKLEIKSAIVGKVVKRQEKDVVIL